MQPPLHSITAFFPSVPTVEASLPCSTTWGDSSLRKSKLLPSHLKSSIPKGTVCALEPPCLCFCHFFISPDDPTPLTCLIKSYASFQTSFRAIFLAEPSLTRWNEFSLAFPWALYSNDYLRLPRNTAHYISNTATTFVIF